METHEPEADGTVVSDTQAEPEPPPHARLDAPRVEAGHEAGQPEAAAPADEDDVAALLFEPARPALLTPEIVAVEPQREPDDAPGVQPPAPVQADAVWGPLEVVLPDWTDPGLPVSATARLRGAEPAAPPQPATPPRASDPLAPLNAMSDEEKIALFS
jgi:hypothetical protein